MKRSAVLSKPSCSDSKRQYLTSDEARGIIDQDESDNEFDFDIDYPDSDLELESEGDSDREDEESEESVDLDLDLADVGDRTQARPTTTGGHGTRGAGDAPHQVDLQQGWGNVFTPVDTIFNDQDCGPQNMPPFITGDSPSLDFLNIFMDDVFWDNLVTQTNRRAAQVKEAKPNGYYAKNFKPTTVEEMKAFIALRLQMETTVIKPRYADYWNSEGTNFISHTPGFREVLSRDRFLALWTFLHVVNEEDESIDKRDKIYKVRPMLVDLMAKSKLYYKPKRHLSLDEGMIPTKNRLAIKQYIKDKPVKFGIKSFMLCEGDTGYIISSEIYTGREEMQHPSLGAVGNVVTRLLHAADANGKNHVVVMDRYYNSVTLYQHLYTQEKTLAVGTAMTNRKFYPKTLKKRKMPTRGSYEFLCRENITCLVWMDKRPINFISNYHDPGVVGTAQRRNKDGTLIEIPMPQAVKDYNQYMGGCDKNDQLTRLHRTRRHYRWPRRLFIKLFMWALYNSYVLMANFKPEAFKKTTFKGYIDQICLSLVGSFRTAAVRRLSREHNMPQRLQNVGLHFPEVPNETSKDHTCVVCEEKHTKYKKSHPGVSYKDNPYKRVKTIIWCGYCHRYLCIKRGTTCWQDWHNKVEYWK